MRKYAPSSAALNETLEKVLSSDTFARSGRARDLLRYLVEREQAGEADRLKGFSIAVDVFGKDAEFDPSTDAHVRVQAGRLRDLLAQYFASEGAGEPIHISIPRGSYVPTYSEGAMSPATETEAAAQKAASPVQSRSRPGRRSITDYIVNQLRLILASVAVVIAMLLYQVYDRTSSEPIVPEQHTSNTADEVNSLPNIYVNVVGDGAPQKVAAVLRSAVSSFDTVAFIAHEPPDKAGAKPLDFVLDVSPGPEDGSAAILLQNLPSGKVIATKTLSAAQVAPAQLDDQIADLISATMPVSGAVYGFLEAQNLAHGLAKCLLLNDDYYLDQEPENHKVAYDCFEKLDKEGVRSPLIFSELASLHLESVTDRYGYPPDASKETALELAHKAIQMAPTSPYAHRAYGFIYSGLGNRQESIKWTRKAYELSRFDLSMAAAYGYALILAGEYAEGAPVMSRAVNAASARPSWWDYTLFLGEFMLDHNAEAIRAADGLGTSKRPHYLAVRLLAADMKGDTSTAQQLLTDLIKRHKSFVADPRATYVKAGYPTDMIDKLVTGLRRAGLVDES